MHITHVEGKISQITTGTRPNSEWCVPIEVLPANNRKNNNIGGGFITYWEAPTSPDSTP